MLTPERRAVLLLLTLAVVGQGIRHLATKAGEAPGQIQLLSALPAGSPSAQRDSTMQQARPLGPGERIDVDRASAAELARLPRIGLGLAKAIVANREANGAFGGLTGLDRVSGVGPGLLRTVAPHLTFSGTNERKPVAIATGAGLGTAFASPLTESISGAQAGLRETVLNVNQATALDLERLPGIGPALARRIVADREARGPFATVAAMDRVPGIGPALVERLGSVVTAP